MCSTPCIFQGEHIGEEGVVNIAAALKSGLILEKIKLRGIILAHSQVLYSFRFHTENDIGNEGARVLADALCENRTVTVLDLSNNTIGDDGCASIATVLLQDNCLKKLLLGGGWNLNHDNAKYSFHKQ